MNTTAPTFRAILATKARLLLLGAVGFIGTAGVLLAVVAINPQPASSPVERPVAPGSVADLLERGDCWSGAQPAGKVVGRVVVTLAGADRPVYIAEGHPLYLDAFVNAGVLEGEPSDAIRSVHGFCE